MVAHNTRALELMRRLREQWIADMEATLDQIDPGLLAGRIGTGALPRGTMVSRGDYTPAGRYRAGDVVIAGGVTYVALVAPGTIAPGDDDAVWLPLGLVPHALVGPMHTASGLVAGQVLTAIGPLAFAFAPARALVPVTNGDPAYPELVFDGGDVVLEAVTL